MLHKVYICKLMWEPVWFIQSIWKTLFLRNRNRFYKNSRHTGKAGFWRMASTLGLWTSGGLDSGRQEAWHLDTWTSGCLDSGRLEVGLWTLGFWTTGLWTTWPLDKQKLEKLLSKAIIDNKRTIALLEYLLIYRSSRPEVFCKKGVLKNFAKLTGKHLYHSLFFKKAAGWCKQHY